MMTLDRNLKNNLNEIGKVYEKRQWHKKKHQAAADWQRHSQIWG